MSPTRRAVVAWVSAAGVLVVVGLLILSGAVSTTPKYPALADEPDDAVPGTIAYTTFSGDQNQCLYTVPAAGGDPKQVDCADYVDGIVWTAKGQLLFRRSFERKVVDSEPEDVDPALGGVSPAEERFTTEREMVLWDTSSSKPAEVIPLSDLSAEKRRELRRLPLSVNPTKRADGAVLRTPYGGDSSIVVKYPDGKKQTILSVEEGSYGYWTAHWSPDGKWILVADSSSRLLIVGATGDPGPRVLATAQSMGFESAWYIPGNSTYTVTPPD